MKLSGSDKVFLQRSIYTIDPIRIGSFGNMINLRYLDPQKRLMNLQNYILAIHILAFF